MVLRKTLVRFRNALLRRLLSIVLPRDGHGDLIRLGSKYGGWIVPRWVLKPGAICYCAGVGEDATFDIALAEEFQCSVFSFDPTPRAVEYVRGLGESAPFTFLPVGVGGAPDRIVRFFAPANPEHVSHSATNLQRTTTFFEARCRTIGSLMRELGHDEVAILKLDIEGLEYETLDQVVADNIRPKVICVEFDQPAPLRRTLSMIHKLRGHGYTLAAVDGWNYTFASEM